MTLYKGHLLGGWSLQPSASNPLTSYFMNKNDLLNVKPVWSRTAKEYYNFISEPDSYVRLIERPLLEEFFSRLKPARVLDLGCGCGHYAMHLTRTGAKVIGLDLSAEMLSIARAEASREGLEIDLREFDIRSPLPFQDETFDLVLSSTVLHYVKDLDPVFSQISRVLKPGGSLLLSVLHPFNTSLFPTLEQNHQSNESWNPKYFDCERRHIFPPWSQASAGDADAPPLIECHHHTLQEYISGILKHSLRLKDLREPAPAQTLAKENAERFSYSNSLPIFLIVHAEKG